MVCKFAHAQKGGAHKELAGGFALIEHRLELVSLEHQPCLRQRPRASYAALLEFMHISAVQQYPLARTASNLRHRLPHAHPLNLIVCADATEVRRVTTCGTPAMCKHASV